MISIEPVSEAECDEFFRYLNDHRRDNGQATTGYFIPSSRNESATPYSKEESFRAGLHLSVGFAGWRRAWIARNAARQIIGHVDLRSHAGTYMEHRCLLGMGVHRDHRKKGLGAALMAFAERWASQQAGLEWLDLEVLAANESAIRLYTRAGFTKVGEVAEQFRIDGQSMGRTTMAKRILRSGPETVSPIGA